MVTLIEKIFGKKKYLINVKCSNCSFFGEMKVPVGVTVESFLKEATCEECKCKTLKGGYYNERSIGKGSNEWHTDKFSC